MLTEQEQKALLHFTHSSLVFPDGRLRSLASSITNGRMNPPSREEAVKCILLHAESLYSVLNNKKVTAAVLLKYLHNLNISAPGNADKETLIHKIYSEWNFPLPTTLQNNSINMSGQSNLLSLRPSTSPYAETIATHQLAKEVNSLAFDDFMVNFAKMFYELLNNPAGGFFHGLNQSHFFEECKITIHIKGEIEEIEQTGESVVDVLRLLSDLRREHNLSFNPNLTTEGIRGKTDSHGLIYAVASGTLHHGVGKLVGVYEQSFILRKDPFEQNSCKIADSTLILRSTNSVESFSQLLLPISGRNNQRNFAIQDAPASGNQLQLTYHS